MGVPFDVESCKAWFGANFSWNMRDTHFQKKYEKIVALYNEVKCIDKLLPHLHSKRRSSVSVMQIEDQHEDLKNQISSLLSIYDDETKVKILLDLLDEHRPRTSIELQAFANIKEVETQAMTSSLKEAKIVRRTIYAAVLGPDMKTSTVTQLNMYATNVSEFCFNQKIFFSHS